LQSARDLEDLPLIWRERGAGTRATVEQALKEHGLNVRKLDRRVEIGSTEAIKALVIAEIGIAFFSCWEIQNELATGTMREIPIPGLRIQRVFSWALPSGDLGGLPGVLSIRQFDPNRAFCRQHTEMERIGLNDK
jgi:DNA-binding transcriptional LysR family regulator